MDTLILGCTHFPLLADILSDYMGEGVTLIDSGREAAAECARRLKQENLLSPESRESRCRFLSVTVRRASLRSRNAFWAGRSAASWRRSSWRLFTGGC